MATKKITRRRNGNGGNGRKIPLAVILGLVPGITWAASAPEGIRQGMERAIMAYTGFVPYARRWDFNVLQYGLIPLMGGFFIHFLAGAVGLNKLIGRFKLPVEI